MTCSPRALITLLSLIAVGAGCPGAEPGDSATATDTAATESAGPTTTEPTTTEPTDTGVDTDTDGSLICPEPEEDGTIGFGLVPGTLPDEGELDVACEVTGGSSGGAFSALIELDCLDGEGTTHAVSLQLTLFNDPELAVFGATQVRLRTASVYTFGQDDQMLTLRGENDELLVFAARGYDSFTPELAPFWAPLKFAPAEAGLCAKYGDCDEFQRTALDITIAGVTERVFDRMWVQFKAATFAAHVGSANIADYSSEACPVGDAPQGLEVSVVVVALAP